MNEGGIGLVLTALMILLFLGSLRATFAVLLSIPLSALAAFICIRIGGRIDQHDGARRAWRSPFRGSSITRLWCSRTSFAIWRWENRPKSQQKRAARKCSSPCSPRPSPPRSCSFPLRFSIGVSRYLFTALALSVVFSLFASYIVAMTVVPLYCARFIKPSTAHASEDEEIDAKDSSNIEDGQISFFQRIVARLQPALPAACSNRYVIVGQSSDSASGHTDHWHPWAWCLSSLRSFHSLAVLISRAPIPASSSSTSNVPSGTRIELSNNTLRRSRTRFAE